MSNMTALHMAARDGNVELVQDILEGKNGQVKVSINSQNAVGQTPMHLAAKWGRLEVISCLIEEGAGARLRTAQPQPRPCARPPARTRGCSLLNEHLLQLAHALSRALFFCRMWASCACALCSSLSLSRVRADLEIKDRRGRTAVHEADDSIVQARLLRESTKVQTKMDVAKMQQAEDTFELKQARKKGDLTEVELADALKRLKASGTWSFQDFEKQISESQVLEDIHEQELMRIADYMRVRPQEIKNELFKVRHKLMKKHEKEDERQRLEAKRLKEVADHEERRAAEKRREERREEKELFRERTCGKCGQVVCMCV